MRAPKALPAQLHGRTFSRAEAAALGVRDDRLYARDITRIARAAYRHAPLVLGRPEPANTADDDAEARLDLLRALCSRTENSWMSHVTAAQLYGLPLPPRLVNDSRVHLTGVNRSHCSGADPRVVAHRAKKLPEDIHEVNGVRVSSPARLFWELSADLSLLEHIVVGDQLVRKPLIGLEQRRHPLATLEALSEAVTSCRGRPGAPQARAALASVRIGADSPPETLLRLALIRAGLPEPELQVRLDPCNAFSPAADLGYRHARLIIQYDGAHHFTAEQQAVDQWRNAQFERDGWTVVLSNRVDLRENFVRTVQRVEFLLERASR